jgi:hemerythrin-like domain-containing protein
MQGAPLSELLEREHREVDEGVEGFLAGTSEGSGDVEPLLRAMAGLRRHIYLEEEFLFPPLRGAGLMAPVLVMLREHGELWTAMDALDAALADDAGSEGVRAGCHDLLERLDRHNTKEEAIIYPQADEALAESAGAELRAFLETGQLPDGWVAQQARPR